MSRFCRIIQHAKCHECHIGKQVRQKKDGKIQQSSISLSMFQPIQSNSRSLNNKSILINRNNRMTWSVHISHRPTTTNPTTSVMPSRTPPSVFEVIKVALARPPLVTQPFKSTYNFSLSHCYFLPRVFDTSSRMQGAAWHRTSDLASERQTWKTEWRLG